MRCNGKEAGFRGVVDVHLLPNSDSPYGIRQATGNVWEWVETGESQAQLRGGSFDTHCQYYGTLFTPMRAVANLRDNDVGFRIVTDDPNSHPLPQQPDVATRPSPPQNVPQTNPPAPDAPVKQDRRGSVQSVRDEILASMVDIPASTFTRGISAAQAQDMLQAWGLPQSNLTTLVGDGTKRVSLSAFSIARFCVTNQQYREFVRATGHALPEVWQRGYVDETTPPPSNWTRLPVTHVNHHDCQAFCDWVGLKLPLEEQWEFSARGVDGRLYPWGNTFDVARCNCGESGKGQPLPVDWCPDGVSPFDLFNCSGNVMEWCRDTNDQLAIARGGSFATSGPVYGLASFTLWVGRDLRQPFTG